MLTAAVFAITLGVLIFVHELGHFLVARRNGIRADEFGFGFPPRIFGIQSISGKKIKKISEEETISLEVSDEKTREGEVIKEVITDKVKEIDQVTSFKKWRFIWGKKDSEEDESVVQGTIYSINWIPLGGFVKIKGEDGGHSKDKDSFATKSAWVRIKVLGAGILMNFILAWAAISISLIIGSPQVLEEGKTAENSKIQISQVISETPAETMGIKAGDQVLKCENEIEICRKNFATVSEVQNFIGENKGSEIILKIKRGKEILNLKGIPRIEYPQNQGSLGISLAETAIVKYSWYEAVYKGLITALNLIWLILSTFFNIIKDLIVGQKVSVDVSGPVGIAYLTKQVTQLGFTYVLQFVALLSINLGIINGLPFPALDGGRILFILIEKIKGSPVSQKVEQFAHTAGFLALITLMILVTFRDVIKFEIFDKIKNFF